LNVDVLLACCGRFTTGRSISFFIVMKKSTYLLYLLVAVIVCCIAGCDLKKEVVCSGTTMGTTYQVKVVTSVLRPTGSLQGRIDRRLGEINRSMSTFLADSEISRFNAGNAAGDEQAVSVDFFTVMQTARRLYEVTGGAWDGTVMPLVDLWGFGPEGFSGVVPEPEEIERCLDSVGFSGIELGREQTLAKIRPEIRLDLASIAKGYGVDVLATLLRDLGYRNFLVEVGGEVFAEGVRRDEKKWRVGINRPRTDSAFDDVYHVVALAGKALATSGDYRNFFDVAGRRYSHVIDPRTGYPVANGVVSVSVVADTCTLSDGLATAMMVMGAEEAIALANRMPEVSCLVVVQEADGSLTDYRSGGFEFE
jgi:thiamine biosynthesis lipoprotein